MEPIDFLNIVAREKGFEDWDDVLVLIDLEKIDSEHVNKIVKEAMERYGNYKAF